MTGMARSTSVRPGSLVAGFVAGFLSVLVFHQAMLGLLHLAGMTSGTPWSFMSTAPFGVPAVLSAAFWGGLWGCVFVLVRPLFPRGPAYWFTAFVFGALALTLVAWFVVLPLKGMPVGGGWRPAGIATGLLVNGAWGIGTALILAAMGRRATGGR